MNWFWTMAELIIDKGWTDYLKYTDDGISIMDPL